MWNWVYFSKLFNEPGLESQLQEKNASLLSMKHLEAEGYRVYILI